MTRGEIALQLTLAMIEKGQIYVRNSTNEAIGKAVVEIFNTISQNIDYRGTGDSNQ